MLPQQKMKVKKKKIHLKEQRVLLNHQTPGSLVNMTVVNSWGVWGHFSYENHLKLQVTLLTADLSEQLSVFKKEEEMLFPGKLLAFPNMPFK